MADGIVGAISLGFQVTRELAVYYSAFKSYHSDVEAVATRVELVSNVFERMQATIQSLNPVQSDSLKELDRLVIACVDSLRELERYQEKCAKKKHAPDHLKGHIESITKRLVYPFRKSTLEGLQRALDSLIGIVQLMTQISHIDAGKCWNNKMLLSNDQIQRDLQTVLAQQSAHMLNLNSISNQLGSSTDLLLASHSLIYAQLGELESRIKTLADTSQNKEVVLRFPARSEDSTQKTKLLTLPSHDSMTQTVSNGSFLDTLQCRCSEKRYRQPYTGYKISGFFRTKVFRHIPHCPLHIDSCAVTTVGMRIRIGLLRTAYLLETGIEYGSSYIAPHIRYRNLTSRARSPMFRILSSLSMVVRDHQNDSMSLGDLKRLLDITTKSLVTIFQQGRANVLDLDTYGRNMIHALVEVFDKKDLTVVINYRQDALQTINNFIQVFVNMGAETSIKDQFGENPLTFFILTNIFNDYPNELWSLPVLVEIECSWLDFIRRGSQLFISGPHLAFKKVAKSSPNGISDPPIVMSLLQESESDLQKHLSRRSQSENEAENFELLISAIFWPEGFRQLIAHGILSNDLDSHGYSILDITLRGSALGVIQYLLGLSMSFITPHTWQEANIFHHKRGDMESVEILRCVAAQLAECCQNFRLILTNEFTYPAIENMYDCLYYALDLSVVGAQALYDNGFTQIDYNKKHGDTPLLFHLSYYSHQLEEQLDLIQWFYNKKQSLSSSYPLSYINASQILVNTIFNVGYFEYTSKEILLFLSKYRSMLADAFSDSHQDDCTCFCSVSGCDVITMALTTKSQDIHGRVGRFILTEVFSLLKMNLEERPELIQSALRVKTFDRLGMTHTCSWSHTYFRYERFSEHEKSEIHHTEKDDIAILETLLTHFESEWSNYNGTFLEFLDSHWEPHMEKVLAERRAIPIDREVLDDYGVELIEYGPEEISEPKRLHKRFDMTWFQRVTDAIVDGREINKEDEWGWEL